MTMDDERSTDDEQRVSVTRDDEYQWHTGPKRPTGVADAVEFIDVHKAFGRNKILRGLNLSIPEG
jgi:phospholipid/cholesterol/gamma-HCH transport system ATP-binding protein